MKGNKLNDIISRYKYPLIMLLIGILIISLPIKDLGGDDTVRSADDEERLAHILEISRGVGNAEVLLSDSGAIVVCDGADDAEVRLKIIKSVEAYTGLSFDKIQVLKTRQN